MLLTLLAASAVAVASQDQAATAGPPGASSSPPTATAAPLTVHPPPPGPKTPPAATIVVPTDDTAGGHWASVWPVDAYREHIGGHVVLSCEIDRYGIAERCSVLSEAPAGKGFGAAALQMRPTLKLTPPTGPDGPTDAVEAIAIDFKPPQLDVDFGSADTGGPTAGPMAAAAPQLTMFGNPLPQKDAITMLSNPVWASAASFEDVRSAYPARGNGAEGYAALHCQVDARGRLSRCQVIREAPEDHGFGPAAVSLAAKFRVAPPWSTAPHHAELWVDVPIRFSPRGEDATRTIRSPYWVAGFDPSQALKVFPPEAEAKGLSTGRGVAKCVVAPGGGLVDCAPLESDPAGLGFADAVVKLASTMRLNPWTLDGAPVDGATVLVNIRLNLGSQP